MRERRHQRMADGPDDASRHLIARLAERRVDRRGHDVKSREDLVGVVEPAVGADVDLRAHEDAERRELRVERRGLGEAGLDPFERKSVRHPKPRRVVGDGEIAVAFRLRPQRHRLERVAAVGPVRVRVKVAPDVADRDERGKGVPRRRVDLAAVLAQLRRDPVHPERGVDLLFAGAGELLAARLGADAVEPVLVQQELALERDPAQADVVLLRAGEVEERCAPRAGRHDAQVDLHPARDQHRRLRVAVREDALDRRGADEGGHDRRRVVAAGDDVDVADRLAEAPQAARDREQLESGLLAEPGEHRVRRGARLVEQRASRPLTERGDRLEDVLLRLRLDLRELAETAVLRGLLELVDRRDAQVVVDRSRGRRPHPRDAQEREEPGRHGRLQLLVTDRSPRRDELLDRLADRRADFRDLLEPFLLDELGERLAQIADRARRRTVRHGAEDVLALELEEVRDLVEDVRDRVVVEMEGFARHGSMLRRGAPHLGPRPSASRSDLVTARACRRRPRRRRARAGAARTRRRRPRDRAGP